MQIFQTSSPWIADSLNCVTSMNPANRFFPRGKFLALMAAVFATLGLVICLVLIVLRRPHPPGPPPRPERAPVRLAPVEATPQVWVIAIGIDQYKDAAIPSCHGATRDARAVGKWFARTGGWNARNVLLMDDMGQPTPDAASGPLENLLPTRANLDWAFKEWLGPRVKPDDTVVIYYAGQAVASPPRTDDPLESPVRSYLLPIDALSGRWEKTGWQLDEAIDPIAATGRNPVVCWLDTSLMGAGGVSMTRRTSGRRRRRCSKNCPAGRA